MMKKLWAWLLHPVLWLVLGLLAFALLVWMVGPLVAIGNWRPLDSELARWLLLGSLLAVLLARWAWRAWKARSTNAKVLAQLGSLATGEKSASQGAAQEPANPELAALQARFTQALGQLRQVRFANHGKGLAGGWAALSARFGKRYLYELPWYLIIGAPGSGKTTALLNSGLQFPLASTLGEQSIRGLGGTRNCEWWFTDEAVLIDTAGRYTTQTSDEQADASAWQAFLALLKRSRARQPVNGVLVTVSVPDLLMPSAQERATHAQAVRRRVQELHEHLGIRFPIYLLVTKCDLLSGFADFLGEIDKEARATPWGFTYTLDAQLRSDSSAFKTEFDALELRLHQGLVDRLQAERDPQRRARIYGFPQQFAGLREVLNQFAQTVFSASNYEQHPLLRGVYFVSGTQEGTPIDRLLGRVSRNFGLAGAAAPAMAGQGRSYFLTRLLREVVFAESGLAGTNLKWERRRGVLTLAGYAALGLLSVGAVAAWAISYHNNQAYVAKVDASLASVQPMVQGAPRANLDPRPLLPRLQAVLALPQGPVEGKVPLSHGFGLYQGDKLDAAARNSYEHLLVQGLLPSIAQRVEQRLRSGDNAELQYEALKTYVMLHEPSRFNAAALKLYVMADWEATLPPDTTTEQRQALEQHLDALLAQGHVASPLALDKELLLETQRRLSATALPSRVYARIKRQGVSEGIAEWSPAKVHQGVPLVFRRASGAPLTKGMPGLFTYQGYHKGLQREVNRVSAQLAEEETWVLGVPSTQRTGGVLGQVQGQAQGQAPTQSQGQSQTQLADQVRRLYLNDYASQWEALIADLRLLQPKNLAEATVLARTLSAPDNPLVPLLSAISQETTLSLPPDLAARGQAAAQGKVDQARRELGSLFGVAPSTSPTLAPGSQIESIVDSRFAALRQHVARVGDKGPAPIDGTLALINEIYTFLNAADTALKAGAPPPPSEVANKVKAEGARTPEPVRSLLNNLSVAGNVLALGVTRSNLGQAINTQLGEFCRQATVGRYPFVRSSERDVTQEDFARLFAPGGLFDDFFQKNLAPFVDTSKRPWVFKEQAGASMGNPGALLNFQRAAAIRETFFRSGSNAPGLRLDFKPEAMDASISQFLLDVDGQVVRYAHGPQIPASVQWPGPRGSTQVRVELSPPLATGRSGMVTSGPWALFRMLDKLQLEPGPAPERFRITFDVTGRKASFEVTTSSVRSPFRLKELEEFSCPAGL